MAQTNDQRCVNTVTVEPGSKTNYYFIPITELQEGTTVRDVWVHIKQAAKRLEWVSVYPDSTEGWICVKSQKTFDKVINILCESLHVQATNIAKLIIASAQNADNQVTIRLPENGSQHIYNIINRSTERRSKELSAGDVIKELPTSCTEEKKIDTREKIIIACGTYFGPDDSPESADSTATSNSRFTQLTQSTQTSYSVPSPTYYPAALCLPPCWCAQCSVYPPPYVHQQWYYQPPDNSYYIQPIGPPAPRAVPTGPPAESLYQITLSNFSCNTAPYQVEKMVRRLVRQFMRDRWFHFAYGNTVIMRTKGDTRKLRKILDGQLLNGTRIRADRGPLLPPQPAISTSWSGWC
ncbi:hypothetical protein F4678DRAFT_462660 [Xylaria arbuscula]|nr:hypothetical protein F4678DRAFT_462660 [Xylaria arbuscula]